MKPLCRKASMTSHCIATPVYKDAKRRVEPEHLAPGVIFPLQLYRLLRRRGRHIRMVISEMPFRERKF